MEDGEDWLLRPILDESRMLSYRDLDDPRMDLADFVFCHEALDVRRENELRVLAHRAKGR